MQAWFQRFGVAFLAGAIGGCAQALVHKLFESWQLVLTRSPWPVLAAGLRWHAVAPYVLAGALWGLLVVPLAALLRVRGLIFGLCLALVPALYALFWQYPRSHGGLSPFAASLGPALLILCGCAAWGLVTGALYQINYRA